jgi:hypothetical protein
MHQVTRDQHCLINSVHIILNHSGTVLGYRLDDRGVEPRQGLGIFLFTTASRPALGPTQPSIQWVPGALSLGVKRPGVKLTTRLHLVPRSRMHGAILPLLLYAFMVWCPVKAQGLYLLL